MANVSHGRRGLARRPNGQAPPTAQFFGNAKPAQTTVEAKFADPKMRVEIDCIAYKPKK